MIERNIGNVERLLRFTFGVGLIVLLLSQPAVTAVEWFIGALAVMLILNGISARCFFWSWFGVNTSTSKDSVPE